MAQRPDYIYTPGSPLQRTAMHLNAADMYGFFVKGDLAKLQASVDATLNRVAAGRTRFQVMARHVMVTFTRVSHAQSDFPDDHNKGWGKETDIATWIMVGQMGANNTLQRLLFYPLHIWVDVAAAISIGREVFGYPKNTCRYEMPQPGDDPLVFRLESEGWHPYNPQTQLDFHPILEITATDTRMAEQSIFDFSDLMGEVVKFLRSENDLLALDDAGKREFALQLLRPVVDQVFLKQFPDGSGLKAVYQAVVAAPATVDKVHRVRLLGHQYQCNLHEFDSFPLKTSLGFTPGMQPAHLAFNINFDFTVHDGVELLQSLPLSSRQTGAVSPQKIAVLGGGVGAMSAAFHLSDQPGWQDRYDITVYQMGWRLGGKGASGRNADVAQRIEEHGLHVWFGFYDNAFALMQKAYAELRRPSGAALETWEDAFKAQQFITLTENIGGQCKIWPIQTPLKTGVPGSGNEHITLAEIVATVWAWIRQWRRELQLHLNMATAADAAPGAGSMAGVAELPDVLNLRSSEHRMLFLSELESIKEELATEVAPRLESDDQARRLFIAIDLATVSLIGIIRDGVLFHGFDAINDIEYRAWLRKHRASEEHTVNSAPVVALYDLVFAYVEGDSNRPNIEAGTMLRGMLRLAVCYHGGIMWKMQAGMGDTMFTPLYQILKERGVKFEFFHKVEELIPDGDGVGEIVVTEQCSLAAGATDYCPLVNVKDLACWPSTPDYAQLDADEARLLQARNVNLESHWSEWPEIYAEHFRKAPPVKRLRRGVDFDKVVLGLSIGSLPHVCPKLLDRSPALKTAVEKVKTVATQAYQVWSSKSIRGLGWSMFGRNGEPPLLSAFSEPFDTWAPMDQLLGREDWLGGQGPENISYFCSPMPLKDLPPPRATGFPALCAEEVKKRAVFQLRNQIFNLWPAVAASGSFDWSVLIAPGNVSGQARFDAQFWRANIDPSELYVISVVGSTQYRLKSDMSGFGNLYLAGDWLKTGLNAGCVEAAVMGGMQASRAICGFPVVIRGEHD